MRINLRLSLVLSIFAIPAAAPAGDRVELHTGEVFEGKIVRSSKEEISIQLSRGGFLTLRRDAVKRLRGGNEDAEAAPVPAQTGGTAKGAHDPPGPSHPAGPSHTPAGPAPAPAGTPEKRLPPPVRSEALGISISPPAGFVPWPEAQSPAVPLAWKHPFTGASVTLAAYPSPDSVLDLKRATVTALGTELSAFRVLRDEKLERPAGAEATGGVPEGWIVEIETRIGGVLVRQAHVFACREGRAIILTFSAAEERSEKHESEFRASWESFRWLEGPPLNR